MNKTILLGVAMGMATLGPADAQEWRSAYTDTNSGLPPEKWSSLK